MQTPPHTLDEWLAHCERLHPKNIDLGLDRVRAVAQPHGAAFGCPVITVAGTNGKGSTCAMLEAICLQAGLAHGGVHVAAPGALRGALPHAWRDRDRAADLVPHFEAVEARARRCVADLFEFTTLAILR
jgi:dihydrofolate synthase/folylpolyglutamate synthase